MARKTWMDGHIWITDDRIVYAGDALPEKTSGTEVVDCRGKYAVPGYVEPHVHPFQLYNPHSLAKYAAVRGTTTLVNDNIVLLLNMEKTKAFSLLKELGRLPTSMFWWARYDAQTEVNNENNVFKNENMLDWLEHPLVVQGGELTAWPQVLRGDDEILEWMQETKRYGKPIEGHLPGASEKTLTQMILLGIDGDHEAMTGEEVLRRMNLGLFTTLRHSSIRPDLPVILQELKAAGISYFDRLHMTTDGSPPSFYENGVMDRLITLR